MKIYFFETKYFCKEMYVAGHAVSSKPRYQSTRHIMSYISLQKFHKFFLFKKIDNFVNLRAVKLRNSAILLILNLIVNLVSKNKSYNVMLE